MDHLDNIEKMLCLPLSDCVALCKNLPRAEGLDAVMTRLNEFRQSTLGDGMLAASLNAGPVERLSEGSQYDDTVLELQRIWTSNSEAYPVGGRKRKTMTAWTRRVLLDAEVFVGEGDVALAQAFDDHALLNSLGLHSIVNVPVIRPDGTCFATFNVSGCRDRWTVGEVTFIRLLALLATPALLQASLVL